MISDSGYIKTWLPSPCNWTFWRWFTDVIHNRLGTFDGETFCRVCLSCYAHWYNCATFRFHSVTHIFCIFVVLPVDVEADTSNPVLCSRCSAITTSALPLKATKLPSVAHPSPSTPPLKATKLPSVAHPSSSIHRHWKLPSYPQLHTHHIHANHYLHTHPQVHAHGRFHTHNLKQAHSFLNRLLPIFN